MRLEECWPILYDLLRIVRDERLYTTSRKEGETAYATFEEYVEARFGPGLRLSRNLEAEHRLLAVAPQDEAEEGTP